LPHGSQAPSPVGAIASGSKAPIEQAVYMKLTKKQLSASYVMKATASKSLSEQAYPGGFTKGDVANHGNSRFDRCPMASPPGKVESIPQVSFCTTSRERVWSPYQAFIQVHTPTGLEKHSQLNERHPSCNVAEGPQSVSLGYLLRKWQGGMAMAATSKAVPPSSECE
jgi:hypothetical protein